MAGRSSPRLCTVAAALALTMAACSSSRPPGDAAAARAPVVTGPPDAALSQRMREVALQHCGTCHQASRPTARAAALAIYNLDTPDWSATLSRAQLEGGFSRRLKSQLDEQGLRLLREFVAAELARRPAS
jgi:mono/diheme cytochrome c family protein